jgi:hypothetical protein
MFAAEELAIPAGDSATNGTIPVDEIEAEPAGSDAEIR